MKREIPWPEGECPKAPDWMENPFITTASTYQGYTGCSKELLSAQERYDRKEITLIELKEIQEGKGE